MTLEEAKILSKLSCEKRKQHTTYSLDFNLVDTVKFNFLTRLLIDMVLKTTKIFARSSVEKPARSKKINSWSNSFYLR